MEAKLLTYCLRVSHGRGSTHEKPRNYGSTLAATSYLGYNAFVGSELLVGKQTKSLLSQPVKKV